MKTDVAELDPTRVRLTVQVPFSELEQEFAAAYRALGSQIRIPGFRPGRVPRQVIDARLGRGTVLEQVVNDSLPRLYARAVEESGAQVVGQPEIEITDIDDGQALGFTAEVDIKPVFDLPDTAGLEVTVDAASVSDDDVEAELDTLRDRFATVTVVERAAADGDAVRIDLRAERDGELVRGGEATGQTYVVGRESMIDGLDEALRGVSAGESATFSSRLVGEDEETAPADITVTVIEVRERVLPELDDDFASLASEFDTATELRENTRERLQSIVLRRQLAAARDAVLTTYLDKVDMALPEKTVEHETQHRKDALLQEVQRFGMTRGDYLRRLDLDEDAWHEDLTTRSRESIKAEWALDALAENLQLSVDEGELTGVIVERAAATGMPPDAFAQQVMESGQISSLVREVVRGKALAKLVREATVVDSEGHSVDIVELEAKISPPASTASSVEDGSDPDSDAGADTDSSADSETDAG